MGIKVKVHWHIPSKKYSVSTHIPGKGWRVLRYPHGTQIFVEYVTLTDAKFVVSSAGKSRAKKKGVRNVHAYIIGNLVYQYTRDAPNNLEGAPVYYSLYGYEEAEFRYIESQEPVKEAKKVIMGIIDNKPKVVVCTE